MIANGGSTVFFLACVASVSFGFGTKEFKKDQGTGFLVSAAREMEREPKKMKEGEGEGKDPFLPTSSPGILLAPFFARSSTLVPRFLLRNRTEKLAMQAIFFPMSLLLPYLSLFTAAVHISFQVPGWIGDARFGLKKERWIDFMIIKMCRWTKICKISHANHAFCPIVGIPSKITHLFHVSSMYS